MIEANQKPGAGENNTTSSKKSSWGLLLLGSLGTTTGTSGKTSDRRRMDRSDRRCDSCGDRDTKVSKVVAAMPAMFMPPKFMHEPIEIKIDLERIVSPIEEAVVPYANVAAAKAAAAGLV